MKKLLSARILPYLYFIAGSGFWLIMDIFNAGKVNFIALLILSLITTQMIYKNKVVGLCIRTISMLISVYMFFAVLSEFRDFPQINSSALQLITLGSLISASCFLMGMLILIPPFKKGLKKMIIAD